MAGEAEIKWAEPPPKRNSGYDWPTIAKKMRRRPGEWALIFQGDKTSIVNALRAGSIRVLSPELGFEYRTANNKAGSPRTCDLYARFVTPEEDA